MLEAKYLNVDNTDRYRPIIRLFYLNYEKLKYWIYQEEVYEELKEDPYFQEYTPEQCQQDLTALTAWGNLITTQDTRRVTTIEEFKNKKFRYQLSKATVEIERMVIRVENLFIESSSLEPTLLERVRMNLEKIPQMQNEEPEKIYSWWNNLGSDFIRLNQNYQDYMRELNSVKAEQMMKTQEFLIFKDRLIEYLRSFVKSLQINASAIEQYLKNTEEHQIIAILEKEAKYEVSIPQIDVELTKEMILDKVTGRWQSLKEWFMATEDQQSEVVRVFDTTNEIIRKIRMNRISTTEVADCLGKTGVFKDSHAVNRGHFAVGNVKWIYALDESNWSIHEQIREVQAGDVVMIEAFNCGDRAIIGELVTKFAVLYREAVAIISNANMRDANDIIKQNYPMWCKGFSPVGCFNKYIEQPLDSVIEKEHRDKYEGSIAVCDDTGVVIIPKEQHTEEFLKKLENIENQEDIWFEYLDKYKWDTYDIVCLKKYLND